MESTINVKLDFSGLKKIEKTCKALDSLCVRSGVLEGDAETLQKAELNEGGGPWVYEYGPYAGEPVDVPARSFIHGGARLRLDSAFSRGEKVLKMDFTPNGVTKALEAMGAELAEGQNNALEYNGVGIEGWLPHNEYRTVATKGFDRPLWSRRNKTFPISYKVVNK